MTRDVCVCGHLEQTHVAVGGDATGACHSPTCECSAFVSEDDAVEETIAA